MRAEVCAGRGCLTPLSDEEWHEDEGGSHTYEPLSGVLDRLKHLERVFSAVYDLDRCEHGRHERDVCNECQRATDGRRHNLGNPHAYDIVGYNISGRPVTPYMLHQIASPPAPPSMHPQEGEDTTE